MWPKNVRYLDYNASSGVSDHVRSQLTSLLNQEPFLFANPSSIHRLGQKATHFLIEARLGIAHSLGQRVSPDDLVFTSSGTEANQSVIHSLSKTARGVIIGAAEHSASHDLLEALSGVWTRSLPLLSNGQYDFGALAQYLQDAKAEGLTSVGLSLFWANNETGVITNLTSLRNVIEQSPIPVTLHLDGAQVWGKLECDLESTPAHFITFSAHKIGAPAGVGIIWIHPGAPFQPLIPGTQNRGLRGGTENLLGICATHFAARAIDVAAFQAHTSMLQARLESGLQELGVSVKIWGSESPRVSNTTRVSFENGRAYGDWVALLDIRGFAVSHGSACRARVVEPSRVLLAMGASREEALNSIRVSFGPQNDLNDVSDFLQALRDILSVKEGLKSQS